MDTALILGITGTVLGGLGTVIGVLAFLRTYVREQPKVVGRVLGTTHILDESGRFDFTMVEAAFTNNSDLANSITGFELEASPPYEFRDGIALHEQNESGELTLISTMARDTGPKSLTVHGQTLAIRWLDHPVNLAPHVTQQGHIAFPLPSIPREDIRGIDFRLHVGLGQGDPLVLELPNEYVPFELPKPEDAEIDPPP